MACYRNGGCGPYEMRSCSECPASKPEYAKRMPAKIEAQPWQPQDLIDDLQLMIDEEPDRYLNDRRTTLCMARDYLKEFFGIDQKPLTFEELQEMEEKPVWVKHWHGGEWVIVHWNYVRDIASTCKACLHEHEYGKTWWAYRQKPKEG